MDVTLRHRSLHLAMPSRLQSFLRDPATVLGLAIVVIVVIGAIAGPVLGLQDPTEINLEERLLSPDLESPLGTDHLGRDELSRLIYGARTTLRTAAVVLAVVFAIALTVGTLSGYYGGWLDTFLMSVVDLVLAFPGLILAVAIAGTLGPSLMNVMIAMSAVWWAGYARLVRGMVLSIRSREFVEAARAVGASDRRIMVFHIWRNILGPVVVLATLDMGWIILGISGLSFLGLGAQPPTPEWGAMLNDGRPFLQTAPQMMLYPGVAIFLVVLGFNLLGDGLRDILDPTFYRR
ncbi:MAG: nickel ABC transporter permease subunit NikC [SAR202 cluster bacterium Io17-Chloro-G9]|nr:MAG: nickel ABC transporter permease subunit NikC [SAR202 cluster bacterium Io17-Chloro-G9]